MDLELKEEDIQMEKAIGRLIGISNLLNCLGFSLEDEREQYFADGVHVLQGALDNVIEELDGIRTQRQK